MHAGLVATLAILMSFVLVLELPLGAQAANVVYFNGDVKQGTWKVSPQLSSTGNQAYSQFAAATIELDNGQSITTGTGGATQTYSRRVVWLSCRWTNSGFPNNTAPLKCTLIG
jgi:hypothetical protein